MFNFNFDWNAISNFGNTFNPVAFEQEVAALANVATAAAVSAPAVVNAPVNVAPTPAAVQPVVQQVIQSVAPVVAPNVPPATLTKLEPIITEQIVSSPAVISSPAGATVSPKVVENIVSSVGTVASKSPEFVQSITPATATMPYDTTKPATIVAAPADTTKPGGTLDLSNQKAETLKTTDSIRAATPEAYQATSTEPSRFVNNKYFTGITLEAEAMPGSTIEDRLEAERIAAIQQTIIPTEKEIAGMPETTRAELREQIAARTASLEKTVPETLDKLASEIPTPQEIEAAAAETAAENALRDAEAASAAAAGETALAEAQTAQKEAEKGTFVAEGLGGDLSKIGSAGLAAAIAQLTNIGLNPNELLGAMYDIRQLYPDISSEDALSLLKYDKRFNSAYETRFSGNKLRAQAGLAPLGDKEYLANEAAYRKIFNAYGLKQFANPENYAKFIGSDTAPDEIGSRVSLVYNRIQNAPSDVMKALKQFYPQLTNADLMGYALDPANQLPELQKKVQAAEIGGEALRQGLSTSLGATTFTGAQADPYTNVSRGTIGVEAIQRENLTPAEVAAAAKSVARVLPEAEKLSSIYAGRTAEYGQKEAEQQYYQGLASAERAQRNLTELEKASFQGSAGRARTGKGSTAGML